MISSSRMKRPIIASAAHKKEKPGRGSSGLGGVTERIHRTRFHFLLCEMKPYHAKLFKCRVILSFWFAALFL